jgi:hypothetical protein
MMHAASCELHNKTNMKLTRIQTATTQFTHLYPLHKQGLTVISYQYLYLADRDRIYLDSHLILGGKGIVTHINSGLEGTAEKTGNWGGGAEDTGGGAG